MRICALPLILILAAATGCGGSGSAPISNSQLSGSYEFIMTSNVTGGTTIVEANLAPAGSESRAVGPGEAQILTFENKRWYVNGVCAGASPGQNSVTTGVSKGGVALNFDQGGNILTGQGVLTGNSISANYSVTASKCPDLVGVVGFPAGTDSGGIIGTSVADLAGTFSGPLTLPDGTYNANLTLTEAADRTLTVGAALSGAAGSQMFPLTGSAVGNIMLVSGTVFGKPLTLFGYFDLTGRFTGFPHSMLIFNYNTLANSGLLFQQ